MGARHAVPPDLRSRAGPDADLDARRPSHRLRFRPGGKNAVESLLAAIGRRGRRGAADAEPESASACVLSSEREVPRVPRAESADVLRHHDPADGGRREVRMEARSTDRFSEDTVRRAEPCLLAGRAMARVPVGRVWPLRSVRAPVSWTGRQVAGVHGRRCSSCLVARSPRDARHAPSSRFSRTAICGNSSRPSGT